MKTQDRCVLLVLAALLAILVTSVIIMGFFNKLFSGKANVTEPASRAQTTSRHNEEWAVYFSSINDNKVGSIMVDLGLKNIAPVKDKLNLLEVSIKMNNPREDGLSSSEESIILNEMDDKLVDLIKANHEAIYAGRLNSEGKLRIYFYVGDTTFCEKTIAAVMSAYPSYQFEHKVSEEKEWESYRDFLYPLPIQMQSIQNQLVVENLRKNGDKLEKARLVEHWIYFKNARDREKYLTKIEGMKFEIVNKGINDLSEENPYQLKISREDKVDSQSVDAYVLPLWQFAEECDGDYDGWETSVVRD